MASICIPAYNAEKFIDETLHSALSQDYENIEIIVSDDCSTDRTVAIVNEYKTRGVMLIKNSKNLGMFANFNRLIRSSSGKYILKLDADDLIEPNHVSEQVSMMELDSDIVFAHCACQLIDINSKPIGYERSIQGSFVRDGKEEWPRYLIGPRAVNIVTIRRSAFDTCGGYDERYRYSGDWSMHRKLLKLGKVYYNDHVIAKYRVHSVGKKGIRELLAKERLMHLEDIERDWPASIGSKDLLLEKARKKLAFSTIIDAAFSTGKEREQILDLVPLYGNDIKFRIMSSIILMGGAPIIRFQRNYILLLRQYVKSFLYRDLL